jgi:hypothetical protein
LTARRTYTFVPRHSQVGPAQLTTAASGNFLKTSKLKTVNAHTHVIVFRKYQKQHPVTSKKNSLKIFLCIFRKYQKQQNDTGVTQLGRAQDTHLEHRASEVKDRCENIC